MKENLLINSFFAAQFNYCSLIWMIHSRFSNNRVKYLSTWKIPSSEFLLLNKNKNHNNSYNSYKNTNLVTIPKGIYFWFWFRNLSKNQTFPGTRIQVAEVEKNPKMNTMKQNYCAINIAIFVWFVLSYCNSSYGHFKQNR